MSNKSAHTRQHGSGSVTPLDAHRRRHRLDHLLSVRAELSRLAAERRSHRLDDADEAYRLQLAVEDTIQQEFPTTFFERFSDWTGEDSRNEHPVGQLSPDCGICQSIAVERGLNLVPPEAA